MPRRTRPTNRPLPAHPYRDTALVYGVMATLLVVVAALTGGDVVRAVLVAAVFFVVATAWTGWKFRTRIRERDAAAAASPPGGDHDRSNGDEGGSGEG